CVYCEQVFDIMGAEGRDMQPPDDRKLRELILHIAKESMGDTRFGKTKLNKLLFYADFLAYQKTGQSITGEEYVKQPFGPVPARAEQCLRALESGGALAIA